MDSELLVAVGEAAKRLALGRTLVYDLVLRGLIPSVKIGRVRRIPVAALEDYVRRLAEEQGAQCRHDLPGGAGVQCQQIIRRKSISDSGRATEWIGQ